MITEFHSNTPQAVRDILQSYYHTGKRLRLFFGDTETGRDWGEENDVIGMIGASIGGTRKIPILLANRRSRGGGAIPDHCIVRIIDITTKQELWRHPRYIAHSYEIETLVNNVPVGYIGCKFAVHRHNETSHIANFKTHGQAVRYVAFMRGERMSK